MGDNDKFMDLKYSTVGKIDGSETDSKYYFWESQPYLKSNFRDRRTSEGFRYYDDSNILKYLFFDWVNKWANFSKNSYVEPYKLHPLPIADQILYWQPIFSKHVSDGLVRLEKYQSARSKSGKFDGTEKSYKSILFRAALLTFWKRTLFGLMGLIVTNILSMSLSFLVKRLLEFLNKKSFDFVEILFLLLSIILLQVVDGLLVDNFTFYIYRLICMVHCIFSITVFQHTLSYRRKFFNNVEGSNSLGVCNQVVHSCSPDSECSKNPLYCPALRYQNKRIAPNLFTVDFTDVFYASIFFESLVYIVQFLSNFVYGILLMSLQIKINIWLLYVVGSSFIVLMVFIETFNTYIFKLIFSFRDFRIGKYLHVIPSLPIINKMLLDDLALNVIIDARNNELLLYIIRQFLSFFNRCLYIVCINVSFYLIKSYFVDSVNEASVITDVDTAALMTTFYIFLRIANSMFLVPIGIRILTVAIVSFRRVSRFVTTASPNFYISDNKFTGRLKMTYDLDNKTSQLNKDVMVSYKDASFAWVSNRKDLLNKNYNPHLNNINFELKRGEVVIVTGAQGSGKSNFIKSVLGEMTLVGGSMAVVPLHTSMPIFYASQDVWLKRGTVRSNITFGYKFDEVLYNKVLKGVDLELDISTWEGGEMRKLPDDAHTLSGGQRVRMELARALYAYLVFSQVNKEYNNSQCSFLMCLDSPFHGLDPFVSKTIFHNLFNKTKGLLVKDDLAVVLTSNFQSFDKFVGSSDARLFSQINVFSINKGVFSFSCNFSDYVKFKSNTFLFDSNYSSTLSNETCFMSSLSKDMFNLCSSGALSRSGRRLVTKTKYAETFKQYVMDEFTKAVFNPYLTYFKAAGVNFVIFIVLTLVLTVMDNLKFVFATNLSDYLNKNIEDYNNGQLVDMSEIRSKSHFYRKIVLVFVIVIIALSFLATLFVTSSSIIGCRKIHEYCINSIFNCSSELLKIKEQVGQMMTYLTCDNIIIDDDIPLGFSAALVSFIHTVIYVVTLFYLVPVSIPFFSVTLMLIYRFVLAQYIFATRNLQFGYFETTSQINNVFENAISGSTIYRSYKKESEFLTNVVEHDDYKLRCRFMALTLRVWASILFNWIFSITTFVVLVVLILFDRYTRFKLKIGYFGLGLSLSMNVVKSFTTFSMTFTRLAKFMCNIYRFRSFIPEGTKYKFVKRINTNDESLVVKNHPEFDYKVDMNKLNSRRNVEFKAYNKNFTSLKKMMFKPRINLVDVTKYLSPEHRGVGLRDVCVYTSSEHKSDGMILRNVSASAHRSDIIGIIGRTGAGKTTLLSVLENTVENRTGQVLLDGTDLRELPKNVARQIVGVLPQLPFVFRGWTVRRFLDPRRLFSDNDINEALDKCGLLDFVNNLEGGKKLDSVIIPEDVDTSNMKSRAAYDGSTKTYDRSFTVDLMSLEEDYLLSNTQLRTLSFARLVLYRYFYRMIVVDEPPEEDTSKETDELRSSDRHLGPSIYELLNKYFKHCTTFVTAHDSNALKMCNSVWVLHSGQLIRTCDREDISANESISNVIEQIVKHNTF